MEKLNQFIEGLSQDELEMFERALKEGHISRTIERKKEFFRMKDKICPICGNDVQDDCFVLTFGEPTFRKKAHFCGADCLEYFIHSKFKTEENTKEEQLHKRVKDHAAKTAKNII